MTKFSLTFSISGIPAIFRVLNHTSQKDKIVVKVEKDLAMYTLVKGVLAEAGANSMASWEGTHFFIVEYIRAEFFQAMGQIQERMTQREGSQEPQETEKKPQEAGETSEEEPQEASGVSAEEPLLLSPPGDC
jgi:hypothetical protein